MSNQNGQTRSHSPSDSSHLAAIVASSEDAIISKSLEGIILSWNMGGEKLFGYTADEAIGQHISLIIPGDRLHEEDQILEKVLNNISIGHFETVRLKKGGAPVYVSLTISPLKDAGGKVIGISKIARDITPRKTSEAALVVANEELVYQNIEKEKRSSELEIANNELAFHAEEKADRAVALLLAENDVRMLNEELEGRVKELESFSYSVSHDLRAPLRAVNGYAQMLKNKYAAKLDDEADRLIGKIVDNASKMGQLIDDLLTFSRVGRREVLMMDIPVQEMVTNICAELKQEMGATNITFSIGALSPAKADNTALKQVWVNLISNAIKYSRLKGKAVIEIRSSEEGDEIIYSVSDQGAGFDMRYVAKLFHIFQRLHSEEEFEGTGVGLAIVQRIVQKHGGRVWAEGKVNEGATFYFTMRKTGI